MSNFLSEFPPVTTETWEHAIHEDLKGADYAEKLIWRSPEGIDVKPYYRAEDIAGLKFLDASPGDFPYVRGAHSTGGWRIREDIDAVNPEEANSAARSSVASGAEEIAFSRAAISNASDPGILLTNLGEIPVHLENVSAETVHLLLSRLNRRPSIATVSADLDWSVDPELSADVLARAPACFVPFTVHAGKYADNGATAIEEVGFALASGVDFISTMQDCGIAVDRVADSVVFSFAMGPEYFMQIAKLRAFRVAWAQAVESFGGARDHARARIHARPARWNKTVYDPYVNMLRTTTEAMSAVLGGADSIYIAPFDECYRTHDDISRRLARNTQIILKQEAFLARVADPGGGSYYLETLTDSIARKAWKQLQEIEAAGGFRKATAMIAETLAARKAALDKSVASRRRVLTGTNRFANPAERAHDRMDSVPAADSFRAALPFEQLRLRTERSEIETAKTPRVLLAEIGDARMRSARSTFVADFFACAGLVTVIERFATPQQIASAPADLIVLCSSDAEYLALATALLTELKARGVETPVLVAGNPETSGQLRAAGVTDFIHLRNNPIDLLTSLQQLLGITK